LPVSVVTKYSLFQGGESRPFSACFSVSNDTVDLLLINPILGDRIIRMYHYDPSTALEELTEEAILPHPVHVRDMMLRHKLTADQSLDLNRIFVEYQKFFGEAQKLGKEILKRLAA
jgi:hypothetical protein